MNILFRTSDGEILGHGTAPFNSVDGCAVVTLDIPNQPDRDLHKIDLEYLTLADKTPAETAVSRQPTALELKMAVAKELAATDQFEISSRPMTDEQRAAWKVYRQALRDLSKRGLSPVEMMQAWPTHPIGHDPLHLMRQGKHSRFR